MMILVKTTRTLVREIENSIGHLDGAIVDVQSVGGGKIIRIC